MIRRTPDPADVHTVLVADDDDDLRSQLVEALEQDGHRVVEARDGAELFDLVAGGLCGSCARPDVILSDAWIPKLSGLGLLEKLNQAKVRLPVILMTDAASESVGIVAQRLGALGVLKKPVDFDNLRTVVMNATRPRRPAGP
jgi:DNA-binding NtrC family response regulator